MFIGMEPTGLYWLPVYNALVNALPSFGVWQVAPQAVAYGRRMQTSNFSKTDDRDAFLIADLIRQVKCCRPIQHTVVSRHLKEQLRMLQHSEDALIIWRRQLMTILQRVMPEVLEGVKEAQADRILQFFNELPLPDVSEAQWISERLTRGRSRARLAALYRRARSATSSIPDPDQWHKTWHLAWNGWVSARAQTIYSKQMIESSVASHPLTPLLLSVPGVNSMTIAAFFAGAGDLSQYTYARQVEKAFGFDLHRWQSGKMDARPRITKHGYAPARKMFYMAALSAARSPVFKDWYQRRIVRRNNQNKLPVVIALAAKLVRICFKIAVTGVPFNESLAINAITHE
jgi:transposase